MERLSFGIFESHQGGKKSQIEKRRKQMKKILLLILLGIAIISFGSLFTEKVYAETIDYEKLEKVLIAYVNSDGRVNYDGLKSNRIVLDDFITNQVENVDISSFSDNEKKAFWINAYNALTMRLIIDHYPLKFGGIRTINWGRPWSIKMKVAGQQLTLGDIEHKILRKWDPIDPRIHFAINCASISCPSIFPTHFSSSKLDEQLDDAARNFVNDSQKNRLDRSTKIFHHSAIFNWFEEDFLTNDEDKLTYILQYLNNNDKQFVLDNKSEIKLKEDKYDWGLNKQGEN